MFAELQAKVGAVISVIASNPDLAAQVRAAIDSAQAESALQDQQAADDARANALNQLIVGVRETLATAAGVVEDPIEEVPAEDPGSG